MSDDPEAVRRAAFAALARGDAAAGIALYRRVLDLRPGDVDAHAQLAHAFERRHDLAAAKAHARAALATVRENSIAGVALARALLREADFDGAERAALVVAQAQGASANDRAVAWGVAGDARDRRGDAPGAFAAFTAANRLMLEKHRALRDAAGQLYHPAGVRAMAQFVAQTDVSAWRRPAAFKTPAAAFLIGFPRSGTTLLDQILSGHSRIVCLEEREYFGQALAQLFKTPAELARMGALADEEIETVRAAYWAAVAAGEGRRDAAVVVDKLPLNIVVLPVIKAIFPDAKIIFALRDPRDVVLSCYQQRFGMNAAMAQFLELDTAAVYYDVVMSLFELCRERLALDLHVVRYEDVVADLEAAARALAASFGLPYEESMRNFQATARSREIKTPSMRQVTQPLYASSVGRWRRYAEQLAPILPALDRWAARLGYT